MSGVRFRNDTNERSCGKRTSYFGKRLNVAAACMRTAKHEGKCIGMSYDATKADGVCYGCRQKVGEPHGHDGWSKDGGCDASKRMVECAFCCARFGCAYNAVSYDQGADCASWIEGSRLLCGYGSAYDYDVYEFVGDQIPVGFENANPVCDGCIRSFFEQDALLRR